MVTAILSHSASAHSPAARQFSFTQANGSKIMLRAVENHSNSRIETQSGHTVIWSPKSNSYNYAKLDPKSGELISTNLIAGIDSPTGLKRHLKANSKSQKRTSIDPLKKLSYPEHEKRWEELLKKARARREARRIKQLKLNDPTTTPAKSPNPPTSHTEDSNTKAPSSQTDEKQNRTKNNPTEKVVGLTLVVQFPDDPQTPQIDPHSFPISHSKIDEFLNGTDFNSGGNVGSVRQYFLDQSAGTFDLTNEAPNIITLPNPRNYYAFEDYPNNSVQRFLGNTGRMLVTDAINILKENGYNFDNITVENGSVRATSLFFAGGRLGGLYPHSWNIPNLRIPINGINVPVAKYQITDSLADPTRISPPIGVFAHELGHLLFGLPDLYDGNSQEQPGDLGLGYGVGHYCIMGMIWVDNRYAPPPISIYLKDILGWADITEISPTESFQGTLLAESNQGFKVTNPNDPNEFFMFENNGGSDPWEQLTDQGILIFHVDENQRFNNSESQSSEHHYRVSVEQRDGRLDLENSRGGFGDSSDAWDSSSPIFQSSSNPSSNWWNGTPSNLRVKVESTPGSVMSLTFGDGDSTAPTPNSLSFSSITATDTTSSPSSPTKSVRMVARKASDPSGVQYYFTETSGNPGGSDSGWQDSTIYIDYNLIQGLHYSYTVKARDKSPARNQTTPSTPIIAPFLSSELQKDLDQGGLSTSLEWALGGDPTNPSDDANILPTFSPAPTTLGKPFFEYQESNLARLDPNTSLSVIYSTDLKNWTTANHQGSGSNQISIQRNLNHSGPGLNRVRVQFPTNTTQDLYVSLKVTTTQP